MNDNTLLTAHEAARILRVDPQTVRAYIRNGKLPAARVGKSYLIKPADLDDLLARSTRRSGDSA